jgi:hypothetical protein
VLERNHYRTNTLWHLLLKSLSPTCLPLTVYDRPCQHTGGLAKSLYRGDPRFDPATGVCGGIKYGMDGDWERVGSRPEDDGPCVLLTSHSGYVDAFNRYQLGLVVVQTRFEAESCGDVWSPYNEVQAAHNLSERMCASEQETQEFESPYVNVTQVKNEQYSLVQELLAGNATDSDESEVEEEDPSETFVSAFDYRDSAGGFVALFDLGVFNLGTTGKLGLD